MMKPFFSDFATILGRIYQGNIRYFRNIILQGLLCSTGNDEAFFPEFATICGQISKRNIR